MRKLRFSLVGCGRIWPSHLEALQLVEADAELVSVCDVDPAALNEAARCSGSKPYGDYLAMLSRERPDLVVLCTPSGLHAEQGLRAIEAGCHVLTEKPLATNLSDGRRLVSAARAAGLRLFEVKQNRMNSTLLLLRNAIRDGRFGRIHLVDIDVFWHRPQSYYDQAAWRGTRKLDGGALMNQASHYVDLLDWAFGPVESVHAFTATLGRKIEMEDTASMSVRWRSGALGSVSVTMLTYPRNLEATITVLGERGTVRIGGLAVNEIQKWEFADSSPEDSRVTAASYETSSVYGHGHKPFYRALISALRGEGVLDSEGDSGLRSLEILDAAYRSASEGRTVFIEATNS